MKAKNILRYGSAIVLFAFGILTLFLSTSLFLDLFDVRAREGNYVLFVVWSNFVASILYLFAVYGLIKQKAWTKFVLGSAALILIGSFIALKVHIGNGGLYEVKTVGAMLFRIGVTLLFTIIAIFTIPSGSVSSKST